MISSQPGANINMQICGQRLHSAKRFNCLVLQTYKPFLYHGSWLPLSSNPYMQMLTYAALHHIKEPYTKIKQVKKIISLSVLPKKIMNVTITTMLNKIIACIYQIQKLNNHEAFIYSCSNAHQYQCLV